MNRMEDWVANKLTEEHGIKVVGCTPEGFLIIEERSGYQFLVAAIGVRGVINVSDVDPLFDGETKPQLVVNVPSATLWSGAAINCIHSEFAAFGVLGDISRAARTGDAGSYRDKNKKFFVEAIQQNSNVQCFSYRYDSVFEVGRKNGSNLVVAVIDAYNMSAEDVRNARTRFGHFDVVVKSSSYGSITSSAQEAAQSMGSEALTFRELMLRLAR